MSRQTRAARRRCAQAAAGLDIPAPFTLDEFAARLARRGGRVIRLVPAVLEPVGPAGLLSRTAAADYIYYERRATPFHQAHIVANLAAHIVMAEGEGVSIDRRLVPDVSTELVQMMLGGAPGAQVAPEDAETFALLALDRARLLDIAALTARRRLRALRPLWAAVGRAVPEAAPAGAGRRWRAARLRLGERVIAIRDAQLVLRSYQDPDGRAAASAAAQAAGLGADERAAAVEAAVIAAAAHARTAGHPARRPPGDAVPAAARGGADLPAEAAWLARVSRALAASPLAADRARPAPPGGAQSDSAQPAG